MRKISIFVVCFLGGLSFSEVIGQNLIKNGSFEEGTGGGYYTPLFRAKNWNAPGKGSSDYQFNGKGARVETAYGNRFIGLLFSKGPIDMDYREYAQSRLNEMLLESRIYCLRMSIHLHPRSIHALESIHVGFGNKKYKGWFRKKMLEIDDYIELGDSNDLGDPNSWHEISGVYKAKGNERFIVLGINTAKFELVRIANKRSAMAENAYYFIDNISMSEIQDSSECPCYQHQEDESKSKLVLTDGGHIVNDIQFDYNSDVLTTGSRLELDKVVEYLDENEGLKMRIEGHTDSIGSDSANLTLSLKRAKAVKNYLVLKGIRKKRLRVRGYGSSVPISEENEENRRVELKIIKE